MPDGSPTGSVMLREPAAPEGLPAAADSGRGDGRASGTPGGGAAGAAVPGATLGQTLGWGWLAPPAAPVTQLRQLGVRIGVVAAPQALAQRVTPAVAAGRQPVLAAAVAPVLARAPRLIPRRSRVRGGAIVDRTPITLPAAHWPPPGQAAVAGRTGARRAFQMPLPGASPAPYHRA